MFINTLTRLNKGGCIPELDEALSKLTSQCRVTGKPGKLTLTLKMKPVDNAGDMMEIVDSITVSKPEIPRKSALFYATDDGQLSRNDPNQPELPALREVDGGEVEATVPRVAAGGGK